MSSFKKQEAITIAENEMPKSEIYLIMDWLFLLPTSGTEAVLWNSLGDSHHSVKLKDSDILYVPASCLIHYWGTQLHWSFCIILPSTFPKNQVKNIVSLREHQWVGEINTKLLGKWSHTKQDVLPTTLMKKENIYLHQVSKKLLNSFAPHVPL